MSSYAKNIGSDLTTKILKMVLGILTSILAARSLGPADYGSIKFLILIFATIGQFGQFGIVDATSYFQRKSKYSLERVFNTNFTFLGFIVLLIVLLSVLDRLSGIGYLNEYSTLMIVIAVILASSTLFNSLYTATFVSKNLIIKLNKYQAISNIIGSSILVISFFLGFLTPTLFIAIAATKVLFNLIFFICKSDFHYHFQLDFKLLWDELKYGFFIFVAALAIYLNYKMDQALIKYFLDNSQLGIYTVGVALAEMVLIFPTSVVQSLRGRLLNTSNQDNYKSITAKTVRVAVFLTFILITLAFLSAYLIPYVYGEKYAESTQIVQVLLIGIFFVIIGRIGCHYFVINKRVLIHFFSSLFILLINLIFNLILIPKIGIIGAAIASSISYFVYGAFYIIMFIFVEKIKFTELLIIDRKEFSILKKQFLKRK